MDKEGQRELNVESMRTDDSRSLLGRGGEKDGQRGRGIKGGLVLFFQDRKRLEHEGWSKPRPLRLIPISSSFYSILLLATGSKLWK